MMRTRASDLAAALRRTAARPLSDLATKTHCLRSSLLLFQAVSPAFSLGKGFEFETQASRRFASRSLGSIGSQDVPASGHGGATEQRQRGTLQTGAQQGLRGCADHPGERTA